MTVEGLGTLSTGKKAKAEAPGKEAAACTACREAAATEEAGKGDGLYCKIHRTKGRDLQECDTSPSYLLFQTIFPLFWTLACMI